ncbi:hypothetical protein [Variovorax sp. LjRoot178]|uniref:hypothetical protein n=1 Tax=Variovorax sp. LjRoot178 TaxID=3342277 RepID=UPI003ED01C43
MNDTQKALAALRNAWIEVCRDYGERKLNSEGCLQAALYFHMRRILEEQEAQEEQGSRGWFRVFVEAFVTLPGVPADPEADEPAAGPSCIRVDMIVCKGSELVLAIELKYKPRVFPDQDDLRKDLTSLDQMRNRTRRDQRVTIELQRHRDTEAGDPLRLKISPEAKMVLGVFCSDRYRVDLRDFWTDARPLTGRWAKSFREHLPPKLGLCMAYATDPKSRAGDEPPAIAEFHGRPFAAAVTAT